MLKKIVLPLLVTIGVIGALALIPLLQNQNNPQAALEFQKGMHYVTWSKAAYGTDKSDKSLAKISSLGSNWVAILTTWYQNTCFATDIFPTDKTPSDASIVRAITTAHANNMKVMLKPHLDILDTAYGGWRGEITCTREPDWDKWFEAYKNFMMHYVKIANENNVEMFCVGTELTEMTLAKPEKWRELIGAIREVYNGQLTYAANWNEEYLSISFWDALDYAGIDAYFPLSDEKSPTYEELMEGWKKWAREIEKWQAKINKPVIFPEVGYHSASYAAKEPWIHYGEGDTDLELQVRCYRALLDTFWNKTWFYGMYWWDWGTSVRMGGKENRGFTPQNKPAEDTVKEWYGKKR